jgi:hypothetical protein
VAAIVTTSAGGSEHGAAPDAARLLVDAVHEWARERFGDAATAHVATGSTECTWCPICQLIAALRGDRPEVTDKLATAAATILDVLGSVLVAPAGRTSAPATNPAPTEPPSDPAATRRVASLATAGVSPPPRPAGNQRRPAGPRVQRIDLGPVATGDEDH